MCLFPVFLLAGCGSITTSGGSSGSGGGGGGGGGSAAIPYIWNLFPTSGPPTGGTLVTITGTGLIGTITVEIGGKPATAVTPDGTGTTMTCITPTGTLGSQPLIVRTAGGAATSHFTYGNPTAAISTVSPTSGSTLGGTPVTITGANFGGTVNVTIAGVAATGVSVNAAQTRITCMTGASATAGTGSVVVRTSENGTATAANAFTYVAPPVVSVTSTSPTSGPLAGGTTLTIDGANFGGTLNVTVAGVAATGVTTNTGQTRITCLTGASATALTGNIVVTSSVNGQATVTNAFTYNPLPVIDTISPGSGPQRGGTQVTIQGHNFTGTPTVRFGTAGATIVSFTTTTIICQTPASTTASTVDVVVNSVASGPVTRTAAFAYYPPTITSVTPATGPQKGGTSVEIGGTDLVGVPTVRFGTATATVLSVTEPTSITCQAPAAAASGAVPVSVTYAATGTVTRTSGYTYYPPSITSISPADGAIAGGTAVTITGVDFEGVPSVTFGGVPATSVVLAVFGSVVTCVTPPGAAAGYCDVVLTCSTSGTATKTSGFRYWSPPTITDVNPVGGPITGGTYLIVNGDGFAGTVSVTIGSVAAPTSSVTVNAAGTQIACATPPSITYGSKDVVVQSSVTGTATLTSGFTYNPSYKAMVSFTAGNGSRAIAVADFCGNGVPDIAFVNQNQDTVSVSLTSTPAGSADLVAPSFNVTPGPPPALPFSTGVGPRGITIGDLDRNGRPDIVTANANDGTVSVLRNVGKIEQARDTVPGIDQADLAVRVDLFTGSATSGLSAVAVADVNNDGNPDIVATAENDSTVVVWLNGTTLPWPGFLTFTGPFTFSTGTNPVGLAVADLDGDGRLDLVTANRSSNNVTVYLNSTTPNTSPPTFQAAASFSTDTTPHDVIVFDVNGDGKQDIVTASLVNSTASVLINNDTLPEALVPLFKAAVNFPVGSLPSSLAKADINGDGKLDIVTANTGSGSVSVCLNLTPPGPASTTVPVLGLRSDMASGGTPLAIAFADFNGDGLLDVVSADPSVPSINVILCDTPSTTPTASCAAKMDQTAGNSPTAAAVADLDRDGKPDVIVVNQNAGLAGEVSVLQNTTVPGTTTFTYSLATAATVGISPTAVAACDLNLDGLVDLVTTDTGSNQISVLQSSLPYPSFAPAPSSPFAVPSPRGLALADFNLDGLPDLVVAESAANRIIVFQNTSTPGGAIALTGLAPIATSMQPWAVAVRDFNGDGRPDIVATNYMSSTISVFINSTLPGAAPTFVAAQDFACGLYPIGVTTLDVNGDGQMDAATVNDSGSVSILLNRTYPGDAAAFFYSPTADFMTGPTGAGPTDIDTADVNGDGKLDLVVSNRNTNKVAVFLNTTAPGTYAPSFANRIDFTTGGMPSCVRIRDLNGDGQPDLVVGNSADNTISSLRNNIR